MRFIGAIMMSGVLLAGIPAAAQDTPAPDVQPCAPSRQFAALAMIPDVDGLYWVPMTLNGSQKYFILQTGDMPAQLFIQAAQDLNLAPEPAGTIMDIYGNTSNKRVPVTSLQIGRINYTNPGYFMVAPQGNPNYGSSRLQAGKLGLSLLRSYDLDMDFTVNRLNIFSTDHCPGQLPVPQVMAGTSVEYTQDQLGQIRIPAKLDGVEVSAVLATGIAHTTLNQSVAEDKLDVDLDGKDVKQQTLGKTKTYSKQFKTLEFAGMTIVAPDVEIMPDLKSRNYNRAGQEDRFEFSTVIITQTQSGRTLAADMRLPDITIGANTLKGMHLYLASKEMKLYIAPMPLPPTPQP